MKSYLILLLVPFTFSCKHKWHVDPEAKKLNDSAALMWRLPSADTSDRGLVNKSGSGKDQSIEIVSKAPRQLSHGPKVFEPNDDSLYRFKIRLLNQAIKIDSNYFLAYFNKFNFECHLKQYKDAVVTGKKLINLRPRDTLVKYMVGKILYSKNGDSSNARNYFKDYLSYCSRRLDTMSVKNKNWSSLELQTAVVLIILDQPQKGRIMLDKLYSQAGPWEKDWYASYMRLTKADLLSCKDTSIMIGDQSTSVNTLFP